TAVSCLAFQAARKPSCLAAALLSFVLSVCQLCDLVPKAFGMCGCEAWAFLSVYAFSIIFIYSLFLLIFLSVFVKPLGSTK
ncbi:MAG: hypothetical protein ACK4RM_11330, partial [Flavobacterium sp.]